MLNDSDSVASAPDVINAQIECLSDPPMDAAKDDRVFINLSFIDRFDILLHEAQLLVFFEVSFTLSERLVLAHALEEIIIDHTLDLFEVELVCFPLAHFFAFVAKQVEESLEDAGHLHDIQFFQVAEGLFPVLRSQWSVVTISSISILN